MTAAQLVKSLSGNVTLHPVVALGSLVKAEAPPRLYGTKNFWEACL